METARENLRYDCDSSRLGAGLARKFAALSPDAELEAWVERYGSAPHGLVATRVGQVLSAFASVYEVHAWLGLYAMHLLSSAQFRDLLGPGPFARLLDVGAGAGYVTEQARPLFHSITCSETSPAMRRRLRGRGFTVCAGDLASLPQASFDVVSCFNVLDRTERPLSLLQQACECLAPDGRLLLSVPLPLAPHVHVPGGTISPDERLPLGAPDWERAATDLTIQVLEPAGLTVERLSRVPYLSRGDSYRSRYVLDAGVWLCRRA